MGNKIFVLFEWEDCSYDTYPRFVAWFHQIPTIEQFSLSFGVNTLHPLTIQSYDELLERGESGRYELKCYAEGFGYKMAT